MWQCWNHKPRWLLTFALFAILFNASQCVIAAGFFFFKKCSAEGTLVNPQGFVCPHLTLSNSLITRRKSKNYTSSLKCCSPVVKGSVGVVGGWGWWYSWAQHLESLSSTNELWWKTNVSAPPPVPSVKPCSRTGAVFTLARMATARSAASTLTPDPHCEGQESSWDFMGATNTISQTYMNTITVVLCQNIQMAHYRLRKQNDWYILHLFYLFILKLRPQTASSLKGLNAHIFKSRVKYDITLLVQKLNIKTSSCCVSACLLKPLTHWITMTHWAVIWLPEISRHHLPAFSSKAPLYAHNYCR